jgi:glyoxylase-like metal-dependent hydrolase (beta-lactamase superfamily II)
VTNLTRVSRFGLVNALLVEEDDGLTVVDTGLAGSAKAIRTAADRLGRPIARILLTHAHGDHVGSLDALAEGLPGVEVLISERDAPLLAQDKTPRPGEPGDARYRGSYPGTRTRPTRLLVPGDRVGSLEVLAAPGHTPGHVAFFDRRDGTLLCGDTFTTLGGVATTNKLRLPFPLASMATWDGPTELASARAVRALEPARLAPSHGKVVESPLAAMDAAIAKGAA